MGVSFAIITVASGAFSQMYANGFCPVADDGTKLPCPEAYGALLGTSACCALIEVLLAFVPPKTMQKIFPPIVTGPTVMLIGINLISSGFEDWAGGSGCTTGLCPSATAPRAMPWGSAEFIGLGFLVFVSILICERIGSPIMRSCSVVIGLLVGCIVAAGCGYFDRSGIDAVCFLTADLSFKCICFMELTKFLGPHRVLHLGQNVPSHSIWPNGSPSARCLHYLRL
jgi:NCS2 family nucleobase:cation symporter-2